MSGKPKSNVDIMSVKGPSTNITFLGIVISMTTITVSISDVAECHKCTKNNCYVSLLGKLSLACKIVPAGRLSEYLCIDL